MAATAGNNKAALLCGIFAVTKKLTNRLPSLKFTSTFSQSSDRAGIQFGKQGFWQAEPVVRVRVEPLEGTVSLVKPPYRMNFKLTQSRPRPLQTFQRIQIDEATCVARRAAPNIRNRRPCLIWRCVLRCLIMLLMTIESRTGTRRLMELPILHDCS